MVPFSLVLYMGKGSDGVSFEELAAQIGLKGNRRSGK